MPRLTFLPLAPLQSLTSIYRTSNFGTQGELVFGSFTGLLRTTLGMGASTM